MIYILFFIYIIEIVIYDVMSYVLIVKHSEYPDYSVGYHVKIAIESKEKWDFSNITAGILCLIFSVILLICAVATLFMHMSKLIAVILLFSVSIISVFSTIILPIAFCKNKFK